MSRRAILACGVFVAGLLVGASASRPVRGQEPAFMFITHGVASGDVSARGAVVWSRANRPAWLTVEVDSDPAFTQPRVWLAEATTATDFTAHAKLVGLEPGMTYAYRVHFTAFGEGGLPVESERLVGWFRTAPGLADGRPLSFVLSGDVGGQRYCRRVDLGYPIFAAMQALNADFFLANGDMIYADWDCPAEGPTGFPEWQNVPGDFPGIDDRKVDWTDLALVREVYLQHWRYNRADPVLQEFLRTTPMYAQWDDHEVISDFGGGWSYWNSDTAERSGFQNLVAAGRQAFFDYSPFDRHPEDRNRIYRSVTWGRHLELFILDGRSYRDRNDQPDTDEQPKTLLGSEQPAWLKQRLAASPATWKVVSSNVPLSIPSGRRRGAYGRDSWANGTTTSSFSAQTGFERELLDLLRFLDERDVANLLFVTTDAHLAQITAYETDFNGDGDPLVFHQLIVGPLSAELSEHRELDPTLQPTLIYVETGFFNFGYIRIEPGADGKAHLVADVRDEDGQPRPGSLLDLTPR